MEASAHTTNGVSSRVKSEVETAIQGSEVDLTL
jgi:hypothetical protein